MPANEFRWETPPAKGQLRRRTKYAPIAQQLRRSPGRWALIRTCHNMATARCLASALRRGQMPAFRPLGSFEALHRMVDGEPRVYARFVGGGLS